MKFFNLDSPVMRFLSRMGDLMLLNVLAVVFSLPVITAGASFTALHYVCLKLVRGEEGYLAKDFVKSFKQNFKQATIIWAFGLVIIAIFVCDYFILLNGENMPQGLGTIVIAISIIIFYVTRYVFPVLSHFENTVGKTIKNGVFMSILATPKSICMAVLEIAPLVILFYTVRLIPLVLFFGLSLPAYLGAMMYNGTFKRFEPESEEKVVSDEEFHVVVDEGEEGSSNVDTESEGLEDR